MAYTKQNFVDGMLLNAEHLETIEDGILELEESAVSLEEDISALEGSIERILNSDNCNVKYIESNDTSNLLVLREFESGTYILYGKFKPFAGSTSTLTFSSALLVNIVTKTAGTHVQVFYPVNNCVQFLNITDDAYERTNIYLNDLLTYVGTLSDLTTTEKSNLVAAINEVKNAVSKKSTPMNLLDNSDFTNPVNQRNVDSSGWIDGNEGDGWIDRIGIDRWYSYNSKAEVRDGYIRIPANGRMTQITNIGSRAAGRSYTVAIGRHTSSGTSVISGAITVPSTLPTSDTELGYTVTGTLRISLHYSPTIGVYFNINNTSETTGYGILWAALYEGEYTAETVPEYRPKGYGAELAECQRYYRRIGNTKWNTLLGTALGYTETGLYFGIPGITMRGVYSVNTVTDITTLQYTTGTLAAAQQASGVAAYNAHDSAVTMSVSGSFERLQSYSLWLVKGIIEISAEL